MLFRQGGYEAGQGAACCVRDGCAGGSFGFSVEEGKPFQASEFGNSNSFLVAIKTAKSSNIKYIALGHHMEGITPSDTYRLSLKDVKKNIEDYHLREVKDNYVLFVLDKYTEDNSTIRAFDKDGKLNTHYGVRIGCPNCVTDTGDRREYK